MSYIERHIGSYYEKNRLLNSLDFSSEATFIEQAVPKSILCEPLSGKQSALSEEEALQYLRQLGDKNKVFRSFIGQGYYGTYMPSVIKRNIFENPSWYTPYTPYQAEISQGRLESLFNFQTVISDLTGLEIANASLLDEAHAAVEAVGMALRQTSKKEGKILIDKTCFPQTIQVIQTRAEAMNIPIEIVDVASRLRDEPEKIQAVLVQYPNRNGDIVDLNTITKICKEHNIISIVAADLLALTLLKSPGEYGCDICVGSAQRFGVPMGFGGPHAGYIACQGGFKRQLPGRIIGQSKDKHGRIAYRMALQTREQHIRREKATSNVCTAQSLLANLAAMYAVYHGGKGLQKMAQRIHQLTGKLAECLQKTGVIQRQTSFFDTLTLDVSKAQASDIRKKCEAEDINLFYDSDCIRLSCDETTTEAEVNQLIAIMTSVLEDKDSEASSQLEANIPSQLQRRTSVLEHKVFNQYHSETVFMRYAKQLADKDLGLNRAMIPLGSCTMKLNAATAMMPVSWASFSTIHPFCPKDQVTGYHEIIQKLSDKLCEITGFSACSIQPNSGAQGEYAGLLAIRAYHKAKGESQRTIALIPESAHGTNPASAILAGYQVVIVKCDKNGSIEWSDFEKKVQLHHNQLGALMITFPSTYGVFQDNIHIYTELFHTHGGMVYMDGANLNAIVGLSTPEKIGADVCHINLHKTFSIPHGGGGPGVGPICVNDQLAPYLPTDTKGAVTAAPYGSASILLISYMYIIMMGDEGLLEATKRAILNANYMKQKLQEHYEVLYTSKKGWVAHELILNCQDFKKSANITPEDIAKRLIDFGFHAPTLAWPVPGTLMIEPTESETKEEMDRFCDAMIRIREEIAQIEKNPDLKKQNILSNAPHTIYDLAHEWTYAYSKEHACFPNQSIENKLYWPPVNRIDNAHGDRHLVCSCPSIEAYETE